MENGSIWDTILILLFRENLLKNFAWTSWWFRCTSKSFLFVALYLPRKKFQRGAKHNSVHTVELSWRPIIFWTDGHEKKLHRVSKFFNFRATIAPHMNFGMIAQVSNAIFLQWFACVNSASRDVPMTSHRRPGVRYGGPSEGCAQRAGGVQG